MNRRTTLLIVTCCICVAANAQDSQSTVPDWEGTWYGELTNLPARKNAKRIEVKVELGEFPTADKTCSTWRNTYYEGGEVTQVKDFQLCRGTGSADLYIDEGDGVKLTARWLGDVLVSPFKYDDTLLISAMRLRGEVLEEEILTIEDKPAIPGVQPMVATSIQRLVLRRAPPDPQE